MSAFKTIIKTCWNGDQCYRVTTDGVVYRFSYRTVNSNSFRLFTVMDADQYREFLDENEHLLDDGNPSPFSRLFEYLRY